jgi:hypothetical protein
VASLAHLVPWGQQEMHMRHSGSKALKKEENDKLEHKLSTWAIMAVTRGDGFPQINSWKWLIHRIEVKLLTSANAMNLTTFLRSKG